MNRKEALLLLERFQDSYVPVADVEELFGVTAPHTLDYISFGDNGSIGCRSTAIDGMAHFLYKNRDRISDESIELLELYIVAHELKNSEL